MISNRFRLIYLLVFFCFSHTSFGLWNGACWRFWNRLGMKDPLQNAWPLHERGYYRLEGEGDAKRSPYEPLIGKMTYEFENPNWTVFKLGEGSAGKVVFYRFVPLGSEPFMMRYYQPNSENKMAKEKRALEMVRDAIEAYPQYPTFSVIKDYPVPPNLQHRRHWVLESVLGRPLDRILMDDRVPEDLKLKLRMELNSHLRNLTRAMGRKFSLSPSTLRHPISRVRYTDILRYKQNGELLVIIDPSQIVVTFDPKDPYKFEMTLVDAY